MTHPPLLVVGHGTRSDRGVAEFELLIERLGKRMADRGDTRGDTAPDGPLVAGGFIELSAPPLTRAVETLVGAGHRHVVALPLVLVAAGHGKGDIPGAMAREQVRFPGLSYAYGRPLGPHPILLSLLEARVSAALGAGAATGGDSPGTTVLLVGRGSSDPDANAEVVKVARLLWEGRGYDAVETAFVSLARPSVPEGLERARRLGARRIVVAPYFLFPGVLPDRVAQQAQEFAVAHPELEVRVADLIGDCDELADLVLERYDEALRGDIRMNCDTCIYRVAVPGHAHRVGAPQTPHDHPDDPAHSHASDPAHSHASDPAHSHANGAGHSHAIDPAHSHAVDPGHSHEDPGQSHGGHGRGVHGQVREHAHERTHGSRRATAKP